MSDDTPQEGFDSGYFRTVMGHFPTGVTIVSGIAADGRPHGFTIGSFTSVSLDPPLVGFLPQIGSATWAAIAGSGAFCVNILSEQQSDLCWKFAKSKTDDTRFEGVSWRPAPTGSPILDGSVGWIDCTVEEVYDMGDHHFVLGRVGALEAQATSDGDDSAHIPLLFHKGSLGRFTAQA